MRSRTVLIVLVTVCCLAAFSGQALATWYWTHGHSGHLQNVEGTASVTPAANGLKFQPDFDGVAWVHFAVPTVGDKTIGVRYVKLTFNMIHAVNMEISQVRIYRGQALVNTFDVHWSTLGLQTKTLDLGSVKWFKEGMGVSVRVESGPDAGIDEMRFVAVGANFVNLP